MKKLVFLLFAIASRSGAHLFAAWTHQILWPWFVTPITGVVAPSILALWGLSLFLTSILPFHPQWEAINTYTVKAKLDPMMTPALRPIASVFFSALLFFEGWVIHLVMQ